jgi:hypothetical protein
VLEIEPDNCSSEVGTFVPLFALPRYSTCMIFTSPLHLAPFIIRHNRPGCEQVETLWTIGGQNSARAKDFPGVSGRSNAVS